MVRQIELPPRILGLAGTFASGKDTIAAWLNQNYGYYHISTGDMVREIAKAKYNDTNRPTLNKTAKELRAERGGGVLIEEALERFKTIADRYPGGLVVTGIRSIGEVESIKEAGGYLVFIDAPLEDRYKRSKKRARGDEMSLSFEEFAKREKKETTPVDASDKTIQNIATVQEMADIVVINDHELAGFLDDIRQILDLPLLKER